MELRKAENEILQLKRARIEDRKIILQMSFERVEVDRRVLAEEEKKLLDKQNADKKIRDELLTGIQSRLELKSTKFGYHPETLEVIERLTLLEGDKYDRLFQIDFHQCRWGCSRNI